LTEFTSLYKIFLFFKTSRQAMGPTQPPTQWVPKALCLVAKRPCRERTLTSV